MKEKLSTTYDKSTNSAANTLFATLREEFARETHGDFKLENPDKASLTRAITALKKDDWDFSDSALKKVSGVRVSFTNQRTGKVESDVYKIKELKELWENGNYRLPDWRTLADFLLTLQRAYLEVADKVRSKQDRERAVQTLSTLEVYGDAKAYKYSIPKPIISKFIQVWKRKPTPIDKSFLYNHLRKDSDGELYWMKDPQEIKPDKNGNIEEYIEVNVKEDDFWQSFWFINEEKIDNYLNAIPSAMCKIRDERPEAEGLPDESVEDVLLMQFPIAFLSILHMQTVYTVSIDCTKEKDNESLSFCRYDVGAFMGKEKGMLHDTQSIKTTLANNLFTGAYFSKAHVQELKQVSNSRGTAFAYIDLNGIDTVGRAGIERAKAGEAAPPLPPKWGRYLMGVKGDKPIFPIDTKMCLFRLAAFIATVADTSVPALRQVLYVFGDGECGKTTLLEAIRRLIGPSACTTLGGEPKDWCDSKTFAIRNKALVVVSEMGTEPEKFFQDTMIKSMTGQGHFPLRKLYGMAHDYDAEHLMIVVSVNGKMAVKDDFVSSRILPIGMTKNYLFTEMRSKTDLWEDLLSERAEFLQWCFDTKAYYGAQTRPDGRPFMLGPELDMVVTDADYEHLLHSDDELTAEFVSNLRGTAIQHIGQLPNCPFRHLMVYSQSEITKGLNEYRDLLIQKIFVLDPEAQMSNTELNFAMNRFLTDNDDPEIAFLLKELGFKVTKDASIMKGPAFKELRTALLDKGVESKNQGKGRFYCGIRLRRKDERKSLHLGGKEEV